MPISGESAAAVELPGSEGGLLAGARGRGREGEVAFHVTRHTPRQPRGGQRRVLTPTSEGSPHSAGKRMKLDVSSSATAHVKGTLYMNKLKTTAF